LSDGGRARDNHPMSAGTTRMGPVGRIEIDLAKRPDCSLIAFTDDVADLVLVIPMTLPPPAVGQRRMLRLVLPSGAAMSGMAEVRHHRRDRNGVVSGCGVAFVAIGPPQRAALEVFVRANTSVSRVSLPPATRRADEPRRSHQRIPAQIDVQVERPRPATPPPRRAAEVTLEAGDLEDARPELDADVTFDSEHNFYAGFSENIGDGGVFIQSWGAHNVGDRLTLRVTLPDANEPLDIVGEVRWMRIYDRAHETPPGIGLSFVELSPEAKGRIEAFIQQRRPLFYDD